MPTAAADESKFYQDLDKKIEADHEVNRAEYAKTKADGYAKPKAEDHSKFFTELDDAIQKGDQDKLTSMATPPPPLAQSGQPLPAAAKPRDMVEGQNETLLGDLGTALKIGAEISIPQQALGLSQGVINSLAFGGSGKPNVITRALENNVFGPARQMFDDKRKIMEQDYTPETQDVKEKKWLGDSPIQTFADKGFVEGVKNLPGNIWSNPLDVARRGAVEATESMPSSLAMAGPTSLLAKKAGMLAIEKAIAAGVTDKAAIQAAGAAAAKNTAMIIGGAGEGAQGFGDAFNSSYTEAMATPIETLMQNPAFEAALKETNNDLPMAERIKLATQSVAMQNATVAAGVAFGFDSVFGGLGDRYLGGAAMGAKGRVGSMIEGGISETGTEFVQSGGEQFGSNLGTKMFTNKDQSLTEGVGEAAIGGAVSGGIMGVSMGGALHHNDAGIDNNDEAALARHKTAVNLKMANLSTRDLLTLRNSPEQLDKLGIFPDDVSSILEERYAELNLIRGTGGPLAKAATADGTAQNLHDQVVLDREQKRLREQAEADKKFGDLLFAKYDPKAEGITEVAPTAQDYSDVDTLLQRTVDKRVNEIRGKLEGPSPAEQKELDTIAKNQGNPEAMWSMYGYDREAKATQYATQNKQQAVTDFRFTNTTFDFDNNLPATPQDNEHQDLEWARQTQAALLHNKKKNTPLTAQEKAWLEELRLYENPEATAKSEATAQPLTPKPAPKVVTRKIKNGSYVLHDPETGREPEVGGSRMDDEYPNAIQARKAFRMRWDEAQQSEARASELTNSKEVIPDGQETSNAERQGQGETLLDEKPVIGEPTQATEQAAGNSGEAAPPSTGPVLTPDGEARDFPGGTGLQFKVTENSKEDALKKGSFSVTIFNPQDAAGLGSVTAHGDTEQAAYDRAVEQLAPQHRPPASDVVVNTEGTNPVVVNESGVDDTQTPPDQSGQPENAEYYQWKRNAQGGQPFGNKQTVTPLTQALFDEHVKPGGEAKDFSAYKAAHPDVTHISLVEKHDGTTSVEGTGTLEELRPSGKATMAGWIKNVKSFDSPEAKAHGKMADYEDAPASADTTDGQGEDKTPWQMTKAEWSDFVVKKHAADNQWLKNNGYSGEMKANSQAHFNSVKHAMEEGKPVPAHVLAEYPELQADTGQKTNPAGKSEADTPTSQDDSGTTPAEDSDGFQSGLVPPAKNGVYHLKNGNYSRFEQGRGWFKQRKTVEEAASIPERDGFFSPQYRQMDSARWKDVQPSNVSPKADGPTIGGEKSEQEKNKAKLLENRRKKLTEQLANATTAEDRAEIQGKLDKLEQFVTKSDAEKIPPADDKTKPAEDKRKITIRELEGAIHLSLVNDQEIMAHANAISFLVSEPDFVEKVDPIIVAKINDLITLAESKAARDLYATMIVSGKPVLSKSFYESLHDRAAKNFMQRQKEANRNPAVYESAITMAVTESGYDSGTDEGREFKEGFDHALKGKTKSTLPQGKEASLKGYRAAEKWFKTDIGKNWYEGKKGDKQKSTGESLRRAWEQLKKGLDDLTTTDMEKTWAQILKATVRADLFPVDVLGPKATPGARQWVESFRREIYSFADFFAVTATGFEQSKRKRSGSKSENAFLGSWTSNIGRFVERGVQTDEKRVEVTREIALEYQTKVAELAQAFEGAETLAEIQKVLQKLFGAEGETKKYYSSDFYIERKQKLFTTGLSTLFPSELGGGDERYSTWGKLLATETVVPEGQNRKTPLTRPRLDSITRSGMEDTRKGRDITPEELKETFGFADITIGDYVTAQEAKDHLNYVYDALMTMADVFRAEPKHLSFGGNLHLSIGALGHGKAAAHFSPNHPTADGKAVPVINVTNTRGDGAVFHEFVHAIDLLTKDEALTKAINSLKSLLKKRPASPEFLMKKMRSFLVGGSRFTNFGRDSTPKSHARYALENYYKYPDKGGDTTKFANDAALLDAGSEKGYWTSDVEMFARGSEAWVYDFLLDGQKRDDYLISEWAKNGKVIPPTYRGTPYPQGEERARLNAMIGSMFKEIVWDTNGPRLKEDGEWKNGGPKSVAAKAYEAERQRILANFDTIADQIIAEHKLNEKDSQRAREDRAINDLLGAPESYGPEGFVPSAEAKVAKQVIDTVLLDGELGISEERLKGFNYGEEILSYMRRYYFLDYKRDKSQNSWWYTATDLGRSFKIEYESRVEASQAPEQEALSPPNEQTPGGKDTDIGEANINDTLTDDELEQLFDEVVAELEEEASEKPEQEAPGTKVEKQPWTAEDFEEFKRLVEKGRVILLADRSVGLPTIHDFPPTGTVHLGYGAFRTTTAEYEAIWDGGGEMLHTPSGKAYTIVDMVKGTLPFYEQEKVLAFINATLETRPEPTPKFSSGLKAGDVVTVRPHSELWNRVVDGKVKDNDIDGQKVTRISRDINGYEYVELENGKKVKGEDVQNAKEDPAWEAPKAPTPPKRKPGTPSLNDAQLATAKALAANMAKHGVEGIEEALKGLVGIFGGGPNRLNSFPSGFDEDAYAAAKPHFVASAKAFAKAGQSFKDFIRLFFRELVTMFGPGVRPYAVRFAKDYEADYGKVPGVNNDSTIKIDRNAADLPHVRLAGWVTDKLAAREQFSWKELFDKADDSYNGTQGEGKYAVKDAYDAMELGINQYILSRGFGKGANQFLNNGSWRDGVETAEQLESIISIVPTQTKRTKEQEEFQQFSTPPHEAYLAAWVANITPADTMLEPSAGIGGLAIFAKMAGAKVIVNELSSRRMGLLSQLPFDGFYSENAEHLARILPQNIIPTVIVMNPPFSSTAGRVDGQRDTMNGAKHVEQALKKLAPGGRLVAVVGQGMAEGAQTFIPWWNKIKAEYNVRANIGIDGKSYVKYGTTFGNQVLVIDKTGPTPLVSKVITGQVESPKGAFSLLSEIREDRKAPSDQQNTPTPPSTGGGTSGGTTRGPRTSPPKTPSKTDTPTDHTGESGGATDKSEIEVGTNGNQTRKELGNSTFEAYEPQKVKVEGAHSHNTDLVESAALAAVEPPDPTYTPNLPKEVIKQGLLSLPQLEAVIYAGQAFGQWLVNGVRRGFFLGDGTGVGKGRQISAVIMDSLRNGQKKAVWISVKNPLIEDAKRDFGEITGDVSLIFPQAGAYTPTDVIDPKKTGILFTAYSTIIGNSKDKDHITEKAARGEHLQRDRVLQIANWLGKDFDGVIAFDEAHAMGNLIATRGARGTKPATLTAKAGQDLRNLLPKAKILYVSATGATEVANLAYADRLGLWGEGTPFASVIEFINEMSRSVSAMELVAQNLKQMGLYLARSLSFNGIEYSRVEHELSNYQRENYDTMAEAWQIVLQNINEALVTTGVMSDDGKAKGGKSAGEIKGRIMGAFWGSHQRFFNQVITAGAMPSVLEQIDKDLADGKSIILQLTNTNAADQDRALAKMAGRAAAAGETDEDAIEEFDLTPREQLVELLMNAFPVQQYEEVVTGIDDHGNPVLGLAPVVDSNGKAVINQEAVDKRDELVTRIRKMSIPDAALQMLINHYGVDKISEITGRSRRVIFDENGKPKTEKRSKGAVPADAKAFIDGKKRILVFSQAGGTGFSFHADKRFKNTQQRVHYILQPGWSADKAVQGLGRSHRTNQVYAPIYRLVTTDVPAQKRFISSIARRLEQLGALTSGQRDTAGGSLFSAADNLESKYASLAVRSFFTNLVQHGGIGVNQDYANLPDDLLQQLGLGAILDRDGNLNESKIPAVTQFLNRMLSLRVDTQKQVFEIFANEIDIQEQFAKQNGTFDDGLQTIRHKGATVKQSAVVHEDKNTKGKAEYVEIEYKTDTIFYPFSEAARRIQGIGRTVSAGSHGWYSNKRSGRVVGMWSAGTRTLKDGRIVATYGEFRTSGISYVLETEVNADGLERLTEKDARTLWDAENEVRPEFQNHKIHMIVGGVLPIWNRFNNDKIDVTRIQTDDGRVFLGRKIHNNDLVATLENMNVKSSEAKMTGADIIKSVLAGSKVTMASGAQVFKAKVSGEDRVEFKPKGHLSRPQERLMEQSGVFTERIQYEERYFLPNTEKRGGEVMAALMASFNTNAVKVEGKNEAAAGSDIMASRSDTLWSGNTKEDIWSELAGGEFKSVVARLRDTRKIQTVQTTEELPEGAERSGLGGVYDRSTDTMYLVADSIETGRAESVLLHEAFHRAKVLGEMNTILGELSNMERLAKSGSEVAIWFSQAQEKAQVDKDTPQYLEEIGAYAVQQYKESPNSIQRWVDRMLAKVKALLIRALGLRVGKVDPQLLRAIAINGLQATVKDASKVGGFSYSRITARFDSAHRPPKATPAKVTNLMDEGRELDIMALLADKKYEATVEQIKAKAAVIADPTAQNEFNFLGDLAARTERHLDTGGEVTFGKDSPIWKAVRQHGLQALTLRQIAQMYGDDVPQAKAYYEAARKIGAFSNQLMQQADKTVNEWLKLSKEESSAVSTVMLDATIEGVHPDKEKFDPRYNMKQAKTAIEKMVERMANLDPNSDDYGRLADVIADKKARIAKETRRWTEWNRQKGEYAKLSEGSKAIYQAVRAQYDSNLKELQTAISERVARQAPDEESKSAALLRLRQEFDRVIENGPYFPLARFGQYLVIASKQGDRVVKAFESAKEQEAYATEMKALGYAAKMRISSEYSKDVDGISSKFAATVVTSIKESGIDMKEQDKLLDEINQLIAKSMPSLSHRTHFIHRNKVKGFSQDTIRAFAENTMHGAHHIAKMKYSDLLTSALDDLEKQMKEADNADTTKAGQVRNELTIRLEQILNPKTHPVTHALTSMGFLWNIGPSIASGMVNLLQTPMVAGPLMAARLGGWKATSVALAKATSDLMFSPWKLETGFSLLHSKSLTSAEKEMLGVLVADGTVDVTLAHELAQASNTDFLSMAGQSSKGMMLSRAMRLISYPFHVTEVANRQITALAAYRMAMAKHKEHTEAVNAARDITMDAHFDYSQINRARIMEGNARRVLLLFKQYSQQMTFLLARNLHQALKGESKEVKQQAQQVLLGVLGGHFLMSGIQGMPVVGVVGALVGILMRAFGDDKDWDWEVSLRNLMADHMGKTGGEMAMMGPARAVLPGDISSRVSLGDMWLRPPDSTKEGRGAAEQWIQLFLGPIASNSVNMYAGASAIAEGNVWRGTEMMIPKALKDVMRSVRYAREGLTDMTGDNLIAKEDINALEILSQFLGFTPRKVSEMYAGKSAIKNAETIMSRERQKVIREMVDAVNNGDRAAYDKAIERSQEFSTKHPGFRITAANVRDSLRTQARVRQQTKDGVYVTPKHAELREQGRFANLGD